MPRAALRRALIELLAHFPIYRTYATASERPARDWSFPRSCGRRRQRRPVFRPIARSSSRLAAWLGERASDPQARIIQDRAVTQFQQLSAPIAAKAVEDTAFYRYGRLLSRNDVGFEADVLGIDAGQFHARVLRRQADFPHAMLATATHDHKRGEDVRARLAVLSEKAEEWASVLPRWIEQCRPLRRRLGRRAAPACAATSQCCFRRSSAHGRSILRSTMQKGGARSRSGSTRWQEKALREAKLGDRLVRAKRDV